MWPSHQCASPLFLGALSSSSILDSQGSKYRDKLNSFLDPVLQTTGRSRFVRCWHAKTDGWVASTFHSNCDGKGPTVTIVQVGSYIFGGYTDKSWGQFCFFSLLPLFLKGKIRQQDKIHFFYCLPVLSFVPKFDSYPPALYLKTKISSTLFLFLFDCSCTHRQPLRWWSMISGKETE